MGVKTIYTCDECNASPEVTVGEDSSHCSLFTIKYEFEIHGFAGSNSTHGADSSEGELLLCKRCFDKYFNMMNSVINRSGKRLFPLHSRKSCKNND